MGDMIEICDENDSRLREYVDLRDVQLRQNLEHEHGFYIAEGQKVILRAIAAGHEPRSFLLSPKWLPSLSDVVGASTAPCFVMDDATIEKITGFHVHRGALAALHRPAPRELDAVLDRSDRILVAEDIVDHTNIGAIMRNVAALGFDAVVLSPRCADPLYRRSIKVAMGAVFSLPWVRAEDWYELPEKIHAHGFTSYAMSLAQDAEPIDTVPRAPKSAIIVGSEGPGLTDHWQRTAHHRVIIPMSDGIDSLNVAASTAIACWQFRMDPQTSIIGDTGQSSG